MKPPAPSRAAASAALHAGAVSLFRMLDLYGERHRVELDELWAAPGTEYLVLFADDSGRDCAILPVGPAHEYRNLDTVVGLRIDGLHAVCYTPARDAQGGDRAPVEVPVARSAESEWNALRAEFPDVAKTLSEGMAADSGADPVGTAMRHLLKTLNEAARHEADLLKREQYVHEAEENLSARAEEHIVRHAELEQREHNIEDARRELDRRTGRTPAPFAPAAIAAAADFANRTV